MLKSLAALIKYCVKTALTLAMGGLLKAPNGAASELLTDLVGLLRVTASAGWGSYRLLIPPFRHDSTQPANHSLNRRPWRPATYESGAILSHPSTHCNRRWHRPHRGTCTHLSQTNKKKRKKKKMVSRRDEGFLESAVCPHTVTRCCKDIRAKSWTSGLRTSWQLLVISRKFNLK